LINFEEDSLQYTISCSAQSPAIPSQKTFNLTVSVVICTRSRSDLLRKCLEGIRRLDPPPDEVIVVDNTDGDPATQSVARQFGARCVTEPLEGLSRARNRGLAVASSDIVAYLDDDAVPYEKWLTFLLEPFQDPRVAVVTGETVPDRCNHDNRHKMQNLSLSNRDPDWFEIANFGGLGIGANMALRKDICSDEKLFDERLGRGALLHGNEEHYTVARLLQHGYYASHVPKAAVVHPFSKERNIEQEAESAIAYWWVLFFEFPGHRTELLKFLFGRVRRRPLAWRRNAPEPGAVLSSSLQTRFMAVVKGTLLYIRARKAGNENGDLSVLRRPDQEP
jgi:glycosyltransferase involved in cell wall biosynthesis